MRKQTFAVLILAALLPSAATAAAAAPAQGAPCGSEEKFNQTKRWEDLPGCAVGYFDNGDAPEAVKVLNETKYQYKKFFEEWKAGVGTKEFLRGIRGAQLLEKLDPDDERNRAKWAGEPLLAAARPSYLEALQSIRKHVAWLEILDEHSFDGNLERVLRDIEKKESPQSIRVNLENGVVPTLRKLKEAGAPDGLHVANDYKGRSYTIAQIGELLPSLRASQQQVQAAADAEYEAKWRPFLSALKGDRLALFKRFEVGILHGPGGRTLRTPEDFLRAPAMFKLTIDESGAVNRWNMTIYRFRGDRIYATETRSGWGNDAPSAAYR